MKEKNEMATMSGTMDGEQLITSLDLAAVTYFNRIRNKNKGRGF